MQIKLIRTEYTDRSTIGEMLVNGVYECLTLEDVVRPEGSPKVFGRTAIPAGIYEVIINLSNRFQRPMPLLLDVPDFSGVRIHSGNTDRDTDGCILVGTTRSPDFIGHSRMAFNALFPKIQRAYNAKEKITLEIIDTGGLEEAA